MPFLLTKIIYYVIFFYMKKITSIIIACIAFLSYHSYGITTDQAYTEALKNNQMYQADKTLYSNYKDLELVLTPNEREVLKTEQRIWVEGLSRHIVIINNQVQITQNLLSYIKDRNGELVDQWNNRIDTGQSCSPIISQTQNVYHPSAVPKTEPYHYTTESHCIDKPTSEQTQSYSNNTGLWILAIIAIIGILRLFGYMKNYENGSSFGEMSNSTPVDRTKTIVTALQNGSSISIRYKVGNSITTSVTTRTGILIGYTQSTVTYRIGGNCNSANIYDINTGNISSISI